MASCPAFDWISIGPDRVVYRENGKEINFRFLPCIIIVHHFYCPTNALNYTKFRS